MDFYVHYAVHNCNTLRETVPENLCSTYYPNDSKSIPCILFLNQLYFRKILVMFANITYIR